MDRCIECVPCEGDGCDRVAYCLSQPGTRPCAHGQALCDDCRLTECGGCCREDDQQRAKCCGRIDSHEPHDWTGLRSEGLGDLVGRLVRVTYHCRPMVTEGGHR